MSLPTLLIKGNLKEVEGGVPQKTLDDYIPVDYVLEWLATRQTWAGVSNRVLFLKSDTGSGKSTAFPAELFLRLVKNAIPLRSIICTQPRILTAVGNVMQIVKHSGEKYAAEFRLGENIGWSTQYNKYKISKPGGLISATLQTLTQILVSSSDKDIMATYKYIIIDEVHQRGVEVDLAILLLKAMLDRNADKPECPFVILMSATFDPTEFGEYFGVSLKTNFIKCAGATATITEHWEWNQNRTVNNVYMATCDIIESILSSVTTSARNDILVFVPGSEERKMLEEIMTSRLGNMERKSVVAHRMLTIDSDAVKTENDDYQQVMKPHEAGNPCNIIISTSVSETGVTYNNLKYVIDFGFDRTMEYNPVHGTLSLLTFPAQKSKLIQRKGRVGRKFPGDYYPLFPKYIYDMLPDQQHPEIIMAEPIKIILQIIYEHYKNARDVEFSLSNMKMPTMPTPDAIFAAIEKLYALGFVSPYGVGHTNMSETETSTDDTKNKEFERNIKATVDDRPNGWNKFSLTRLGHIAVKLYLIPCELIRAIIAAYSHDVCVMDMISIAAGLIVKNAHEEVSAAGKALHKRNKLLNHELFSMLSMHSCIFLNGLRMYLLSCPMLSAAIPSMDELIESYNEREKLLGKVGPLLDEYNKAREDIIAALMGLGLDIGYGKANSIIDTTPDNGFQVCLSKISACIYDGFRCNLLIRRDAPRAKAGKSPYEYYTRSGARVHLPDMARFPMCLIYYTLTVKDSEIQAPVVFPISDHISVDLSFI